MIKVLELIELFMYVIYQLHLIGQFIQLQKNENENDGVKQQGQMSTISALYLSTNPQLVRNRIVRALKARGAGGQDLENCWMVQSEMASSIVKFFFFFPFSLSSLSFH